MNNFMDIMGDMVITTSSPTYIRYLILSIAIILFGIGGSHKPVTRKRVIIGIIIGVISYVLIYITIYLAILLYGAFLSDVWKFVTPYIPNLYYIISSIVVILFIMGISKKPFTLKRVIIGLIIGIMIGVITGIIISVVIELIRSFFIILFYMFCAILSISTKQG